jgi:hypothetical protein
MYRSIILGLIGAVVLLMAIEGAYSAAVFFGAFGLLFLVAPKLSRSQKGVVIQSDSLNEKQKPRTRWMLVGGIILFVFILWSGPKLLSLIGLKPGTPLSAGDNQNPADKPKKSERHVEPEGGFSFIPPDGWEMRSIPQSKFKAAIGPPAGGFTPNILVFKELWPGSLDDYINAATESWVQKKANLVKREDFATAEGLEGRRLILENRGDDVLRRQRMYIFAKGETKYVINCTTVAEGADKLDAVFEGCIQTFRLEGPEK